MNIIRPATPGFLVTLVATLLLLVVSFSVPWFRSVYFLKTVVQQGNQSGYITFGTLGLCTSINNGAVNCTKPSIGYEFDPNKLLGDNIKFLQIPTVVTKWITDALFLHVIAFALAAIAALFGLLAHVREMSMTCFSSCISGFAAAIALVAFIFDLVLFFTAKSRINSVKGGSAIIGNAIWLTLAAWILLFFSGCFYGIGRCCVSRRPRGGAGSRWFPGGNNENQNKDRYEEMMRLDAVKAEADRKARQAAGETGLPAFPTVDERKPLSSNYEAAYYEEEEEAHSYHNAGANLAGAGTGAAVVSRVVGPRKPRRQGTDRSQGSELHEAYSNAAYDSGYTPGSVGSRTVDQYNNGPPGVPQPTQSYSPQRQPTVPGYQTAPHRQYMSPSPSNVYNQPQEQYRMPTSIGAFESRQQSPHQAYPSEPARRYASPEAHPNAGVQYGHGQDQTTYHSAYSHPQEHSYYDTGGHRHGYDGYNDSQTYSQDETSNPQGGITVPGQYPSTQFQDPGPYSGYSSSQVLPTGDSANSQAQPAYHTPLSHQSSRKEPSPNVHRPESSATSYFPYPGVGHGPTRLQSPSPGGLQVVEESTGSTGAPPEYSQVPYRPATTGGWGQKSSDQY